MDKPNFSRDLTPPVLDGQPFQEEAGTGAGQSSSEKSLKPNKFSFSNLSNLFSPISIRPQTPSTHSESPSVPKWSSRVYSFVGLVRKKDSPPSFENLMPESRELEGSVAYSSPATVRVRTSTLMSPNDVLTPTQVSPGSSASDVSDFSSQEATLPQQSFFEAGEQDKNLFVASLMQKLEKAKKSENPEKQTQNDIDRISYLLNGKRVQDVKAVKDFLGKAAESILPILNQTIANTANDIVAQRILEAAPVNTTHAELAMDDSKQDGTSIRISKEEESSDFHIEVESKGSLSIFLKKTQRGRAPSFDMIALAEEAPGSAQAKLSGEGRQFIALELTKDNAGLYSLSCSNLFKKYQIKTPAADSNA